MPKGHLRLAPVRRDNPNENRDGTSRSTCAGSAARNASVDQTDRSGVAVKEIGSADRANLAVAEEAGGGCGAERIDDGFGVVVRAAEEIFAASVAAEEEGRDRFFLAGSEGGEERFQFLVRTGGVA